MPDESGTPRQAVADEVWLAGNVRPAIAAAAATVVVGVLVVAGAALVASPILAGITAACLVVVLGPIAALLVVAASRPRLRRRGGHLEVRLAPFRTDRVPLDVVECVFPGSRPLPAVRGGDEPPGRRVTTVIIRLAERAAAWRNRPTFRPWGTWEDGHLVIDGRWSEPLSPDRTRALAARLVEARNGRTGDCAGVETAVEGSAP